VSTTATRAPKSDIADVDAGLVLGDHWETSAWPGHEAIVAQGDSQMWHGRKIQISF